MNPIVKNVALKLCETAPACILEILFETLIKTWNDYIREYNLPFNSINVADLKGITMARQRDKFNHNISNLDSGHQTCKIVNDEDMAIEQSDEQMFFNYFRDHMENSNHRPPFNLNLIEIQPETSGCRPESLVTIACPESENIHNQLQKTKEKQSTSKVADEVSLIQFALNPEVIGMNGSSQKNAAVSEIENQRELKNDAIPAKEISLTDSRNTRAQSSVAEAPGDWKHDGNVSKNSAVQDLNYDASLSTEINFKAFKNMQSKKSDITGINNLKQRMERTGERNQDIKDDAIPPQEIYLRHHKNVQSDNLPFVPIRGNSEMYVVPREDMPPHGAKYFMKGFHASGNDMNLQVEVQALDNHEQLGLNVTDNLQAKKDSLQFVTESMKQPKYVTDKATNEEANINIGDSFPNDGRLEINNNELSLAMKNVISEFQANLSDDTVYTDDSFEFHVDETNLAKYRSLFEQLNEADIERKWLEPNWSGLQIREIDLSSDWGYPSTISRFSNEAKIKKLDELEVPLNVDTKSDVLSHSGRIEPPHNGLSELRKLQEKDHIDKNMLDVLVEKDLLQFNSFLHGAQKSSLYPSGIAGNKAHAFVEEYLPGPGEGFRTEETAKRIITVCNWKEGNIARKNEKVREGNAKMVPHVKLSDRNEIAKTNKTHEVEDMSREETKTHLKELREFPIDVPEFQILSKNPPLLVSSKGNEISVQDSQNLKVKIDSCTKSIKSTGKQHGQISKQNVDENQDTTDFKEFGRHKSILWNTNPVVQSGKLRFHDALVREGRKSSLKYPLRRMGPAVKAKYNTDSKNRFKSQKKVFQDRNYYKQISDNNKGLESCKFGQLYGVKMENVIGNKLNAKNEPVGTKSIHKSLHSKVAVNKALYKRPPKPSIAVVENAKDKMYETSAPNLAIRGFQTDNRFRSRTTMVFGSCSECKELPPLDMSGDSLIYGNMFIKDSHPEMSTKYRRLRSQSRSSEIKRKRSNLPKTAAKCPSKRVTFIDNSKIFSYDPEKSVFENFSQNRMQKDFKIEECKAVKERYAHIGKLPSRSIENPKEKVTGTGGYMNPGFVDVPLFDCLPDFEHCPPSSNSANFDEDEHLLSPGKAATAITEQTFPRKLSAMSRNAEGSMRKWLKYGLMSRKGLSLKAMKSIMWKK